MQARRALCLTAVAVLLLSACGKKEEPKPVVQSQTPATTGQVSQSTETAQTSSPVQVSQRRENFLSVVCAPGAHGDILDEASLLLAKEGITLEIHDEFDDYLIPNMFVDGGVYDCNFFQHEAYLETFNREQDTQLVSVGRIFFEPLGVYPGRKSALGELGDGDSIAIPADASNQGRALQLLSDLNYLVLSGEKGEAGLSDITGNPHNLNIILMDAALLPSAVSTADYVVMNGNYARQALYTLTVDALAYENPKSASAARYANVIVTRPELAQDPAIRCLVEVLKGDTIRTFIEDHYAGGLVPCSE
ncbi:MAG: metal ABC transporter substrate-binding protein [Butyrivibrio sp.]|nr:metal ABC transporter substrate-binding protein [Butyrivibrio sp.]